MLDKNMYFIREHIGFLKLSDAYDILDPETQEQIGIAKEKVETYVHLLRFLVNKRLLPTKVCVYNGSDPQDENSIVFSINRGFTFLRPKINICDANGTVLGWFQSKMFSIGGAFKVFDASGTQIAMVKGNWRSWNFKFLDNAEKEIGTITRKWGGIGKELFTTADNYIIHLNGGADAGKNVLLLAAGLAVDTIFKER